MAAPHRSKISWTDYSGGDANFVTGCTPVSEGCRNCYARAIYKRFGRNVSQVDCHPDKLERLLNWHPRESGLHPWKGRRPTVFVCDTGDLFHEDVPFEFIEAAFGVMLKRSDIDWQVLTKRPRRMKMFLDQNLRSDVFRHWPFPNIWLGVTAENQETADERIPLLLQVPAAVHFVSVEPMLEPVDLRRWLVCEDCAWWGVTPDRKPWQPLQCGIPQLDWVLAGAESGPSRRPFDVQWALDLYEQCRAAGVSYFYKQGSALRPGQDDELPGIGAVKEWPDA